MGEAGRRAVLGNTWESVCDELVGHYERVILDRVLAVGDTLNSPVATQG
jgi:phosphatidylinositol alpha 1,6-mannosyltransferase